MADGSGAAAGTVPVVNRAAEVRLKRGGAALVRRIRPSKMTEIMEAARLTAGDLASAARFAELVVRYAVTGVRELNDPETGRPVEFQLEPHRQLGPIACVEMYDAIDDADVTAIMAVVRPDGAAAGARAGN
jgi:hypothetical protein